MSTAIITTVCDRPQFSERALAQLAPLGFPLLVVDDSKSRESMLRYLDIVEFLVKEGHKVRYLAMPENRGLAGALNIGLSYFLADPDVEWISYFQDDVDLDPLVMEAIAAVQDPANRPFVTAHDAAEHGTVMQDHVTNGIRCKIKRSCRGTHMHAHRHYWEQVMPIPSRAIGAPKRMPGNPTGMGSNVDWWIATNAPKSVAQTGKMVWCIPGLVRTFLWKGKDSCWDNTQKVGEDLPLSREAITDWISKR